MPQAQDFLCDLCGEFISLQDNPIAVVIYAEQPGDRVGTSYDVSALDPFMRFVSGMRVPRFEACELCCFHATIASDGTRTGPPIFTANVDDPTLLNYFQRHGASLEYPGLSIDDVARRQREEAQAAGVPGTAVAAPAVPVFLPELPPDDPTP